MFVVGLTGGIGSGKTTAAKLFEALGAGVVDTDEIAHALTAAGGGAIAALRSAFGAEFITPAGALDRARMRERAFSDAAAKRQLEEILHPMIRAETTARIRRAVEPYVLAVVPLLLETGGYRELTDRVLVVDCPEAEQVRRAAQRSSLAEDAVRAIMAAQLPRAERLARADDVLANTGGIDDLRQPVERLHARYLALAAAKRSRQDPAASAR